MRANEIVMEVRPGHAFPRPGSIVIGESPMTGIRYEITVKRIVEMHWTQDGSVTVVIAGQKTSAKEAE